MLSEAFHRFLWHFFSSLKINLIVYRSSKVSDCIFKIGNEEILSEEASILQIGSVPFIPGQYISPQLHPCHRLFDQNGHQDSFTPFLYSRPCSLWLLVIPLAQRLSLWDNWGDKRGGDESHWYVYTRGLPWGLTDVVWEVQQVHCSRRRLHRRGQEFHVCTINKSAHTKKSENLSYAPCIYIYIYMCVCVCVCVNMYVYMYMCVCMHVCI